MQVLTVINSVNFDPAARRFEGEVALTLPDGTEETVVASVVGSPQWAFDRIARELVSTARQQSTH